MYVMQATFRAKPGKAQALADKLAAASAKVSGAGVKGTRVLILPKDRVADSNKQSLYAPRADL